MPRFVFIMLDGAGVGALPDAPEYGDAGSDTLGNLSRVVDLRLPFLQTMGLGNILPLMGVPPVSNPVCLPGRLAPVSAGKDTTVGHWEHMGLVTPEPFPTYPAGFPDEVLAPFKERIGRGVLGNKPASGTAIIAELGAEHLKSGKPIVYTSADSVFQVAAHVDVVPLEQLYAWCRIARDILQGGHAVARVIARPFAGRPGAFIRTKDRKDFSLAPPGPTYLDLLEEAGVPVLALGKISEIFTGRGVTTALKAASNEANLQLVLDLLCGRSSEATFDEGLLFTNLVDFDMVWGHRNDSEGFAAGMAAVDRALPDIVSALAPADRLIISADHGVDPTTPSTDHSREYVPLLLYPRPWEARHAVHEGFFSDTGATAYQHLVGEKARPPQQVPAAAKSMLAGNPIGKKRPCRGWRRYTPTQPSPTGAGPDWPGRVGVDEVRAAARWLREHAGPAPDTAIVLGSGLTPRVLLDSALDIAYGYIPHWRVGMVPGHAYRLSVGYWTPDCRLAFLRGRLHGYEGFDLSELQLQSRTLAAWGVPKLLITTACGAVAAGTPAGASVLPAEVVDLQYSASGEKPARLQVNAAGLLDATLYQQTANRPSLAGSHAAVPGPQYETPSEMAVLRAMGVTTVSMSGPAEIRAAQDESLETAMICQVTNAGATTHEEVLAATARAGEAFTSAVMAVLSAWASKSPRG